MTAPDLAASHGTTVRYLEAKLHITAQRCT